MSDDTETRVFNAAGPIFAEKGYQAATVRDICRRAEVNVAAVNYYFGDKQQLYVETIKQAREMGLDVVGPFPADSVFYRAVNGEFDAVMALYHDQGHIAIKVHDFERSVTATMGVPFIRTSVDHGTAFDIAGTGCADATSLVAAVDCAVALAAGTLS